jgi:N-acetylglucosamine-6-phosphate deacetylase
VAPAAAGPVLLTGGRYLDVDAVTFRAGDVLLAGGRVAAVGERPDLPDGVRRSDVRLVDVRGALVTPGLVDAQVNGAAGADLTREPERLPEVARALPRYGVTAFLPTAVTAPAGTVERLLRALALPAGPAAALALGVHAEGPFLAPARRGAHPAEHLRLPDPALVEGWTRAAGVVAVTLAPELPGGLDLVARLAARGVLVWVGHTEATLEQTLAAVRAGARAVTHLYNAMPGLQHREPGPVGAVLGGPGPGGSGPALVAGLVVDGHHVHPTVVRATWNALGPHRLMLVSDATAALGLPDGSTVLGGHDVLLAAGAVRLAADPATLAGSAVGLDHCVRSLVAATGCDPAAAFVSATRTPTDLLGRPDLGRLAPGARADVAVWSPDLALRRVFVAGSEVP